MKKLMRVIVFALAVCMLLPALSGCKTELAGVDDNGEFYTIRMLLPFNSYNLPQDMGKVNDELNRILKEKLNCSVEIEEFLFSEYSTQAGNYVSTNEAYDLVWTNASSYYTYTQSEALYPLDELIEKYASDAALELDNKLWNQVRFSDGKIYAFPNIQILPRTAGYTMRDEQYFYEFMDTKLNIEGFLEKTVEERYAIVNASCSQLSLTDSYTLVEEYMTWLKDNQKGNGGRTYGGDIPYFMETFAGFDDLMTGMGVPGVVRVSDKKEGGIEVFNQFESPEFIQLINKWRDWVGTYIPIDIDQGTYGESNLDVMPTSTWKPGERRETQPGRYQTSFQFGQPHYLQSYITGTMWSISRNSKNPARTMKFLNLLHTDPEIHNLLKYGIKDIHYELVNDGKQAKPLKNTKYTNWTTSWTLGNELIGLPLNLHPVNLYEEVKKINDETPLNDIIGFVFDRTPVLSEIQNCNNVAITYFQIFQNGVKYKNDAEAYNRFIADLNTAGMAKVIAEKQRQLNAWLAL